MKRRPSRYISQPKQKLNAAFKKAAPSAIETAPITSASISKSAPTIATSANSKPTFCANCGGLTSSVGTSPLVFYNFWALYDAVKFVS